MNIANTLLVLNRTSMTIANTLLALNCDLWFIFVCMCVKSCQSVKRHLHLNYPIFCIWCHTCAELKIWSREERSSTVFPHHLKTCQHQMRISARAASPSIFLTFQQTSQVWITHQMPRPHQQMTATPLNKMEEAIELVVPRAVPLGLVGVVVEEEEEEAEVAKEEAEEEEGAEDTLQKKLRCWSKEILHRLITAIADLPTVPNFPGQSPISEFYKALKVARAWRETTPVCSGLTRLVRAGYSRRDSGASRECARITRHAQDGSVHMQLVSRPAPIPPGRL